MLDHLKRMLRSPRSGEPGDEPPADPARPRAFGNYDIEARLGQGGMAEVFRARAVEGPHAGELVAIKRILPGLEKNKKAVSMFLSEAELSRAIDHPNIVKVYEVGELKKVHFIAMELVDGRDLGQILRKCQERKELLPVDYVVYVMRQVLQALAYAHTLKGKDGKLLGLVHCDVGPSNVFVSRDGEIKLGDFGVARGLYEVKEGDPIAGKAHYLSPEALDGQITYEADLWAAAVMFYELLTLRRAFKGANDEEIFSAVRERRYEPAHKLRQEISEELSEVIDRAFAADRADRFLWAADFAEALAGKYDDRVGSPLAIAGLVHHLFG